MTRKLIKNFLVFFVLFIVVAVSFNLLSSPTAQIKKVPLPTLAQQMQDGQVKAIEVSDDELTATLADQSKESVRKEPGETLTTQLKNYGVTDEKLRSVAIDVKEITGWQLFLGALLPFLIPFILVSLFIYIMMRQVRGMNTRAMSFGQSSARETPKDPKNRVTFQDVAGAREAKSELEEIVEFLKNPKKFTQLGAKIPKGVLLLGQPGVGKTLLARAVAGEANVPFFHISGSEFVEMFVGVGASRVRDLFARAKKSTPCIIFIDELDAVGRQRGTGLGGSHDEREQTLNQILVEMDGFDPTLGIIVLAATNRPDVLDPALLRPGRFDRRVVLDPPDINDREAILKIHARNKPLSQDVNIRRIAERTPGMTGADLANLLNEAAILAARRNKKRIENIEILESVEKVLLGPERKSHILSADERRITAYHEGGHALVANSLPHADPVHKVSIISRGRAAGYTMKLPSEERHLKTLSSFRDELAVLLGGHTAEKMIFGEVTTGASSDIKEATRIAKTLVTTYGMSETLGPRTYGEREEMVFLGRDFNENRDYSEKAAERIDVEITKLITEAQNRAKAVLKKRRKVLDRIVEVLLKQETLEKEEFEAICNSTPPSSTIPTNGESASAPSTAPAIAPASHIS